MIREKISFLAKKAENIVGNSNIDALIKIHDTIADEIKSVNIQLMLIKKNFESDKNETFEEIDNEKYRLLQANITEENILKITSMNDIELQIEEYYKLSKDINSCKKFLEKNSLKVVDVESGNSDDSDDSDSDSSDSNVENKKIVDLTSSSSSN